MVVILIFDFLHLMTAIDALHIEIFLGFGYKGFSTCLTFQSPISLVVVIFSMRSNIGAIAFRTF